jgi:hypothetical protein
MNLQKACAAVFEYEASDLFPRGSAAWTVVLAAIKAGTLHVNVSSHGRPLLHCAAYSCSATVVKRLLEMGASPSMMDMHGSCAMHMAVLGGHDVVAKCAMLPPGDLACQSKLFGTPLHACAMKLKMWATPPPRLVNGAFGKYMEALRWMLQQPGCPVDVADRHCRSPMDILNESKHCGEACEMLAVELAPRARWTALRAAWAGVVVAATSVAT